MQAKAAAAPSVTALPAFGAPAERASVQLSIYSVRRFIPPASFEGDVVARANWGGNSDVGGNMERIRGEEGQERYKARCFIT